MNGTEVEFKNVSFTSVGTVGPVPINYSFIKPYLISLSDVPERSLIMLNANYFNGWEISETSSKSVPFFNSMYVINSFFYNSNTTNITIILQSQKSYDYYLAAQWVTWIGLLIMIPTLYLIERKYNL